MELKTTHEPEAKVMNAEETWEDAQQIIAVLRQNLLKSEPVIPLQIPLSIFLAVLDRLSRDELLILKKRVEERLAI